MGVSAMMTQDNPLTWAGPPLTPEQIARLEAQLGAALPDDYRRFLLESNGGIPERGSFTVQLGPPPKWMSPKWQAKWQSRGERWVDSFCTIDERLATPDSQASSDTLSFWLGAADWAPLPPDAIPIGRVSRDDFLLLYIRGPRRGEVHLVAWDYIDETQETTPEAIAEATYFVAPSFEAFFRGLAE
jgi:hypothetical protein